MAIRLASHGGGRVAHPHPATAPGRGLYRCPDARIGRDAKFRRVKGIFPEIISSLELAYFPEISLEFPWKCIMRWRRRRRQRRRRLRRLANEALLFGNSLPTHIIPS